MLNKALHFFLASKPIVISILVLIILGGLITSPFGEQNQGAKELFSAFSNASVSVDALPNIGENQQIVFTKWSGRSPKDIEDQITYPLTTALMGIPGVKSVRSNSVFGFSSIYIIFKDEVDFFWSRSRILEKLNSLSPGTLPEGVQPTLGPDATALGQVFWYTLEGRDEHGNPTGGWDLHELRTAQDFTVKYALGSVEGVAEVASVGGFLKEYQIDIDPVAMKAHNVTVSMIMQSVKNANIDVGARTVEVNRVEYTIRSLGYIKSIKDLENAVVTVRGNVPVRIRNVAKVSLGPAPRRGILDKSGAEAVGGVVVASYEANPMKTISRVKEKIAEIAPGLPKKTLSDGTVSQITVIPFYDRSTLIKETLGTLESALTLEILITALVILLMIRNLGVAGLISGLLPVAVLFTFVGMRLLKVEANIVSLAGIAIAIGTMVDISIVLAENIFKRLRERPLDQTSFQAVFEGTKEVTPAIITAILTTIISFLPVFLMEGAEGKLFKPLAMTKTIALATSLVVAILLIPALSHIFFSGKRNNTHILDRWKKRFPLNVQPYIKHLDLFLISFLLIIYLAQYWMPLGPQVHGIFQFLFVGGIIYGLIALFFLIIKYYENILTWCLEHKFTFLSIPLIISSYAIVIWFGYGNLSSFAPKNLKENFLYQYFDKQFPGMGKEFMPALDEGAFLLMPVSMPHAGIEENLEVLQQLDMAVYGIPEIEMVVGKLGRVESALDPAPITMYENLIHYKSEYKTNENGKRIKFKTNKNGSFVKDSLDQLIPDKRGEYFRQWRPHIKSPDDIWKEIAAIQLPGVTSAPKLQPIETRLVMLQTGMRAPMGIKVKGSNLDSVQAFASRLEGVLKKVNGIQPATVFADRIISRPYLVIDINREKIARYGLTISRIQEIIEIAIGGKAQSQSVEGRERYAIRVRYARELRDNPSDIGRILIPTPEGQQIPLSEFAEITYSRGPQMIRSEDNFLVAYVLFDKEAGIAENNAVENARQTLEKHINAGKLSIPAGVSYTFAGSYENQIRAEKRLLLIVPVVLLVVFMILYLQFKSIPVSLMIFSGIWVALCGGFILLWLYGQPWFLNIELGSLNIRELFNIESINLSVAVWVGFIALFGIATDDGVVIATYLKQIFEKNKPNNIKEVRKSVIEAGKRRIRPCLMTTATTLLALLPILSSDGRGADIMIPMAIPLFGGMLIELITLFIVPVLFSIWKEAKMSG